MTDKWIVSKVIVPVLLGLLAIAVAWGAYGEVLSSTQKQVEENTEDIRTLEQAIPRIDTNIEWIKETLTQMNGR